MGCLTANFMEKLSSHYDVSVTSDRPMSCLGEAIDPLDLKCIIATRSALPMFPDRYHVLGFARGCFCGAVSPGTVSDQNSTL
jgi:hypothetical protein